MPLGSAATDTAHPEQKIKRPIKRGIRGPGEDRKTDRKFLSTVGGWKGTKMMERNDLGKQVNTLLQIECHCPARLVEVFRQA